MKQKRARHLMTELTRKMYLNYHGSLKGFGKISKFYNDKWSPMFFTSGINSYSEAWNSNAMKLLRERVGMR